MGGVGDVCERRKSATLHCFFDTKGPFTYNYGAQPSYHSSIQTSYLQIRNVVPAICADSQLEALVIFDLKGPGHGDFDGAVPCAFDATL